MFYHFLFFSSFPFLDNSDLAIPFPVTRSRGEKTQFSKWLIIEFKFRNNVYVKNVWKKPQKLLKKGYNDFYFYYINLLRPIHNEYILAKYSLTWLLILWCFVSVCICKTWNASICANSCEKKYEKKNKPEQYTFKWCYNGRFLYIWKYTLSSYLAFNIL